jgi:hypothetical protein
MLGAGALLAALLSLLPPLATWSERALVLLLLGVSGYVASAVVVARWPPSPPALRRLRAARREIDRLLAERGTFVSTALRPQWDQLAADALLRLDEEIAPALVQLLDRSAGLRRHLAAYERDQRPAPDPAMLDQLRGIQARQDAAVAACVKGAVDAEGSLLALLQEHDDAALLGRLRSWVADLAGLHTRLAEALAGERPSQRPAPVLEPLVPLSAEKAPPQEYRIGLGEQPGMEDLVREALRHLNKPATLARCELAARLPRSLDQIRRGWGEAHGNPATPLEQSQALREALLGAIERLKAIGDEGSPQTLQYEVLRQAYVLGMSTKHIMVRHAISEATLHRRRQEGIRAVAAELSMRERLLTRRPDPVALDYLG